MTPSKLRPIHAGEILREEFLAPLGMTPHALAMQLRVPAPRINDIVREKRGITADTALRLARFFNTTPQFWLNLQTAYDLKIAENTLSEKINLEVPQLQAA
ncbi:HigA family addiction module antitoxin [Methylophilus glucosoxydans]|uniref:HigA family addiction module antitoxin n=1 Tax=Methylophilus glucosoxydans TaxID=752553 RepID=A0ABW3GIN4_9PROT|nr:HigA family addiction module antitoxin [Methylophilus sp. 13]MBF5039309.1 HigA family addiction module antidote protein [Methylophilus sp. 13]